MRRKKTGAPKIGNQEHFKKKSAWKSKPENRCRMGEPTPMDNLQLVIKPQPGGLVLNWA